MAAQFDLKNDGVVVIIGSGAGGGTLGNELAQKGIDVVILEAGACHEYEDFINDEWDSLPNSPGRTSAPHPASGAWPRIFQTCRPGSSNRSAARPRIGRAPRCASRSMSSRRQRRTAR